MINLHHNNGLQQENISIQKRQQSSVGTRLQKDNLNREKLINELKPLKQKQIIEEKPQEKGKISFSSNHVLPAEKEKKIKNKQNLQQQNSYNAFNMKPIGQIHNSSKNDNKKKNIEKK
jgi:hypothetical protein